MLGRATQLAQPTNGALADLKKHLERSLYDREPVFLQKSCSV